MAGSAFPIRVLIPHSGLELKPHPITGEMVRVVSPGIERWLLNDAVKGNVLYQDGRSTHLDPFVGFTAIDDAVLFWMTWCC